MMTIEEAVALHGDDVYRYCRRMLGNPADAEDVSQLVFVEALRDLGQLARVDHLRAWLFGIARHRCLDRLKSLARGPRNLEEGELDAIPAEPVPLFEGTRDPAVLRALDACLDQLDPRSRAVLVLRFHDELGYEEISARTSDSAGALRVRMTRALVALRRCLEGKGVTP